MKKSDFDGGSKRRLGPLHKHSSGSARRLVAIISLLAMIGVVIPAVASAGVMGDILLALSNKVRGLDVRPGTLQTMPVAQAAKNIDPTPATGGGDIVVVDESALMAEEGPAGTIVDIERPKNQTISLYVVREGDTLSSIADLFGVSRNTILWANDMKRGQALSVGQTLTILPVTGVRYKIRKGDTIESIAKKFSGDANEIASFNGAENDSLAVGSEIIIPDGEITAPVAVTVGKKMVSAKVSVSGRPGSARQSGFYMAPLASYIQTQGVHGYNGVDMAAPVGTPIMAAADGDVIIARGSGYNGGYGDYVVIQHDNGAQTLYAHQSRVIVSVGQSVSKGQIIGYVGSTGKSTGAHLHFEIRGGIRNPF